MFPGAAPATMATCLEVPSCYCPRSFCSLDELAATVLITVNATGNQLDFTENMVWKKKME
jgi:hypothetical protein